MSEHTPKSHEAKKDHESAVSHEHQAHAEKQREAAAEHAKRHIKSAEQVAELHEQAEKHAQPGEDIKAEHLDDEPVQHTYLGTQKQVKDQAYRQTLRATQHKLPKTSRRFSKVIHNDVVNAVSEVGAKTVARPSGLLGGSMVAFFGSVIFLYYARHYGFRYNYLVLFLLFALGFVVGAIIEFIVWAVYSRRHRFE